jgi:prophage antirepressor-like protein
VSTDIVPFVFDGRDVRTVIINSEPWFVAIDLCAILGYTNARKAVSDHVDSDDRDGVTIGDAIGRNQRQTIVNESGLYALIFGSSLPKAKEFKHWVTREVLPQIRRTGQFAIDIPMLTIQPTKYRREFPEEFYRHICRFKGKVMPDDLATEPWLAQATANLIYQRLVENLWKAIQWINPVVGKWRKRKIHQHITDGEAKERFRAFIYECIGAMASFMEWKAFIAHWDRRYPIQRDLPEGASLEFADGQLLLPFVAEGNS